jgi:DNA processing protein
MNIKELTLKSPDYPQSLRDIHSPPNQLFVRGASLTELLKRPVVAVVGSRRTTPYGQQVTVELATKLAEQGVVIVSGLALGIDALAHQSALAAGGTAIAVLPGPVDHIVPATNYRLAQQILDNGGVLVSEYPSGTPALKQQFIARNRIVAGLCQALVITEAGEKSGALHTARFASDQGKDVLVVPNNIHARQSIGTNNLLKRGAGVVTSIDDILHALNLVPHVTIVKKVRGRNAHEQLVLNLMLEGVTAGHVLLERSGLNAIQFSQVLTMLEIGGKIRPLGANHWAIF